MIIVPAARLRDSRTQDFSDKVNEKIKHTKSPFKIIKLKASECLMKYLCGSSGIMEYQKEKQSACKMCCLNNSSRAIALISTIGLTAITCGTYPFYECYAQRQDTKRLLQVRPSQISNIRSAALAESRSPVSPLEFLRNTPAKQEMHS